MLSTNKVLIIPDFEKNSLRRQVQRLEEALEGERFNNAVKVTKLEQKNTWLWTWAYITGFFAMLEGLVLLFR
jgi:type IV secretory pathway component VirB8